MKSIDVSSIQANIAFPALAIVGKTNELFAYSLIISILIIEFIVFSLLAPQKTRLEIAVVVMFMNAASAFVGLFAHLIAESIGARFFFINVPIDMVLQSPLYLLWFISYTTTINTAVEYSIARRFFPEIQPKKLLLYIFIINIVSITVGFGGALGSRPGKESLRPGHVKLQKEST